jgi:acetoin utilization deacetylase AcuC-like enzyme
LSTHQWGIYPGTGWLEDAPEARARIVNVPLSARAGDRTYARVADEIIHPFLRRFQPELVLVSAGFDAHWSDPITSLGLSSAGFHASRSWWVRRRVVRVGLSSSWRVATIR